MVKVKDLRYGLKNFSIVGKIVEKGESRNVMTRFGKKRVADAILEDETGKVKLTLWEDQIDKVNAGSQVKITGAYIKFYQNEMYINVSRSGEIEEI